MRARLAHPDPEVRKRLDQIVTDTERAALLAPRRVTLRLDRVPMKAALAELAKQSGYKIDLQGGGQQQLVSLEAVNVSFWEAFDKLAAQGGLVMQPQHDMQ